MLPCEIQIIGRYLPDSQPHTHSTSTGPSQSHPVIAGEHCRQDTVDRGDMNTFFRWNKTFVIHCYILLSTANCYTLSTKVSLHFTTLLQR